MTIETKIPSEAAESSVAPPKKKTRRKSSTRKKPATVDSAKPEKTTTATKPKPTKFTTGRVDVESVKVDANHRAVDEAKVTTLAASIKVDGLEAEIGVYPTKGADGFTLIYGAHRLAAFKVNGTAKIPAKIYSDDITAATVEKLRTVENLERNDLSPVDEAMAVQRMFVALVGADGEVTNETVHQCADQLGRPATWVRDRAYLSRLNPQIYPMIHDGSLTLNKARAIAMLGNQREQMEVARSASIDADGTQAHMRHTGGLSLAATRSLVRERAKALRSVPWELDVKIGSKPPCATCPSNSANDTNLFEHHEEQPPDTGICTNAACFASKQQTVALRIEDGVTKLKGMDKTQRPPLTAKGLDAAKVTPKGVRASTFARRAKATLDPPKTSKKKTSKKTGGAAHNYQRSPEEERWWTYRDRIRTWKDKARNRIKGVFVEHPPAMLIAFAMQEHPSWLGATLSNQRMFQLPKKRRVFDGAETIRKSNTLQAMIGVLGEHVVPGDVMATPASVMAASDDKQLRELASDVAAALVNREVFYLPPVVDVLAALGCDEKMPKAPTWDMATMTIVGSKEHKKATAKPKASKKTTTKRRSKKTSKRSSSKKKTSTKKKATTNAETETPTPRRGYAELSRTTEQQGDSP